jgi:hypothetical protein
MILFIISGFFILILSVFPCDNGCTNLTFTGIGHNILIKFPSVTIPAAIIISLYPIWRDGNWKKYWWIFPLLIGIYILIYSLLTIFIDPYLINGLLQRLGLFVPISWVFLMSIRIYRLRN